MNADEVPVIHIPSTIASASKKQAKRSRDIVNVTTPTMAEKNKPNAARRRVTMSPEQQPPPRRQTRLSNGIDKSIKQRMYLTNYAPGGYLETHDEKPLGLHQPGSNVVVDEKQIAKGHYGEEFYRKILKPRGFTHRKAKGIMDFEFYHPDNTNGKRLHSYIEICDAFLEMGEDLNKFLKVYGPNPEAKEAEDIDVPSAHHDHDGITSADNDNNEVALGDNDIAPVDDDNDNHGAACVDDVLRDLRVEATQGGEMTMQKLTPRISTLDWKLGGNAVPYSYLKNKVLGEMKANIFVAMLGEEIVGIFSFRFSGRENHDTIILLLWTKGSHRGHGIATELIRMSSDFLIDQSFVMSGPNPTVDSKNLYQRLKFNTINSVGYTIAAKKLRKVLQSRASMVVDDNWGTSLRLLDVHQEQPHLSSALAREQEEWRTTRQEADIIDLSLDDEVISIFYEQKHRLTSSTSSKERNEKRLCNEQTRVQTWDNTRHQKRCKMETAPLQKLPTNGTCEDRIHRTSGPAVKKKLINSPKIVEGITNDTLGQQQQGTIEQRLRHQAEVLGIELSEVKLPQEEKELFECFEIQTDLPKKTQLRKLIRSLQSKPPSDDNKRSKGKIS